MTLRTFLRGLAPLVVALASCVSHGVAVQDRAARDEFEFLAWRPATAADVTGHWRARRIHGQAAPSSTKAVLLDIAYWVNADGHFSGAALLAGSPPACQVLSGEWTLDALGMLRLGADAEPARAEVASGLLRLSGGDGSLVLERAEIE